MPRVPLAIFTDLDGTLLDHDTYRWAPAAGVLGGLIAAGVPVVLTSSKTGPEIGALRADMGLAHVPAICENGAGVVPVGAHAQPDPADYHRLRALLDQVPADLRAQYTGFGDMDLAGVVAATGLPPEQAAMAADRAFSEPGLWRGDAAGRAGFIAVLADLGVHARDGGRFLTLGFGRRKVDAMRELLAEFGNPPSIALGDAPNDIEMIEAATHGVIIPNPHRSALPPLDGETTGRVMRAERAGPRGWAHAVQALMGRYI